MTIMVSAENLVDAATQTTLYTGGLFSEGVGGDCCNINIRLAVPDALVTTPRLPSDDDDAYALVVTYTNSSVAPTAANNDDNGDEDDKHNNRFVQDTSLIGDNIVSSAAGNRMIGSNCHPDNHHNNIDNKGVIIMVEDEGEGERGGDADHQVVLVQEQDSSRSCNCSIDEGLSLSSNKTTPPPKPDPHQPDYHTQQQEEEEGRWLQLGIGTYSSSDHGYQHHCHDHLESTISMASGTSCARIGGSSSTGLITLDLDPDLGGSTFGVHSSLQRAGIRAMLADDDEEEETLLYPSPSAAVAGGGHPLNYLGASAYAYRVGVGAGAGIGAGSSGVLSFLPPHNNQNQNQNHMQGGGFIRGLHDHDEHHHACPSASTSRPRWCSSSCRDPPPLSTSPHQIASDSIARPPNLLFGPPQPQHQHQHQHQHAYAYATPSSNSGVTFRVVDHLPIARTTTHSGVWFMLLASHPQAKDPFLPQLPKRFLRVRDGKMTVQLVIKYVANKLGLDTESEVEIRCRGREVAGKMRIEEVRDNIWSARDAAVTLLPNSSTSEHIMLLHYGRK